jgi:TfoX/Sxy family transcriptional regulator of competence genes
MEISKATDEDKLLFRRLVPAASSVEIKPMFGNLGAFVNGNMFAGLFGPSVGIRIIDDADRAELATIEGTGPFGPPERPMSGYVSLPAAWASEPERAARWIEKAMAQVAALPAKAAKPRKKAGP